MRHTRRNLASGKVVVWQLKTRLSFLASSPATIIMKPLFNSCGLTRFGTWLYCDKASISCYGLLEKSVLHTRNVVKSDYVAVFPCYVLLAEASQRANCESDSHIAGGFVAWATKHTAGSLGKRHTILAHSNMAWRFAISLAVRLSTASFTVNEKTAMAARSKSDWLYKILFTLIT